MIGTMPTKCRTHLADALFVLTKFLRAPKNRGWLKEKQKLDDDDYYFIIIIIILFYLFF